MSCDLNLTFAIPIWWILNLYKVNWDVGTHVPEWKCYNYDLVENETHNQSGSFWPCKVKKAMLWGLRKVQQHLRTSSSSDAKRQPGKGLITKTSWNFMQTSTHFNYLSDYRLAPTYRGGSISICLRDHLMLSLVTTPNSFHFSKPKCGMSLYLGHIYLHIHKALL